MSAFDYDQRFFKPVSNSATGEVGSETVFHYRQRGKVVWATYEGGGIEFGTFAEEVR